MSDQFLFGLATSLPSGPGTSLASARNSCASVSLIGVPCLDCATRQAVEADLDLDDVLDAVLLASLELALLHAARGIGGIGMLSPTPAQNSFMPPPVPVDSTTGVFMPAGLAELLGNGGGERIDGRRADDADLVARLGGTCKCGAGNRERGNGCVCREFHGILLRVTECPDIRRVAPEISRDFAESYGCLEQTSMTDRRQSDDRLSA